MIITVPGEKIVFLKGGGAKISYFGQIYTPAKLVKIKNEYWNQLCVLCKGGETGRTARDDKLRRMGTL